MPQKITTIEELGDIVRRGFEDSRSDIAGLDLRLRDVRSDLRAHMTASEKRHHENRESFKSIGDHLVKLDDRLAEFADLQHLTLHVERIRQHLRERDHVEL